MTDAPPCKVAGCTTKSVRRILGVCVMHDSRMRRGEYHSTCLADGCEARAQLRGYCPLHGRRVNLYGDPDGAFERGEKRPCSVDGCDEPHWARTWCRRHYRRWKKNGTVELLTADERFWRQVDRRHYDECWPWTGATIKGYGHSHENRQHYYAHRRSYEMHHGPIPAGFVVRHTCDNPPCVNPAHLTAGTQADNIQDMIDRGRGHWQRGTSGGFLSGGAA